MTQQFSSKESACNAGNAGDPGLIPQLEDSLEVRMATHSSILGWRIPMDRGTWWATAHGVTKTKTQLSNLAHMHYGEDSQFSIVLSPAFWSILF